MNTVIHTEHRDVIHDCSYDYYGQVSIKTHKKHQKINKLINFSANGNLQLRPDNKSLGTE